MREIKFRAWDNKNKRMFYLDRHGLLDSGAEQIMFVCSDLSGDPSQFDWLQYIGLHDKQGVEIYEGDILPSPWGNAFVKYSDDVAEFLAFIKYCSMGGSHSFPLVKTHTGRTKEKVIGNIYENKELLNEEG